MTKVASAKAYLSLRMLLFRRFWPGFVIASMVAVTAEFLSSHYDVPVMLMALLLGMILHFLVEDKQSACGTGVDFTSTIVLKVGIALMGARMSVDVLLVLTTSLITLIAGCVIITIGFGVLISYLLGRDWRFGILTGASVGICGASAAMAVAAVLPKNKNTDQNVIFTVLSVTILSTVAMILYPLLTEVLLLDDKDAGLFLGATIHDVAQVIGAGFSVSEEAGETATVVKLIRVAMLVPVIVVISTAIKLTTAKQKNKGKKPSIFPFFIVCFLVFALANSMQLIPATVLHKFESTSRWALIVAVAAVGIKTSLKGVMEIGGRAITLVVSETAFIAIIFYVGLMIIN